MLPYFDEYKEYLSKNYNKDSARTQETRLTKLCQADKSMLDMSAEELFDLLEVDKKARSTLNSEFSCITSYLNWLHSEYEVLIYECFYQINRLKDLTLKTNYNDISNNFFVNFKELRNNIIKAEENYLREQEIQVSEQKLDTIYLKQKMFNAYVVFLWEQITEDEMLMLSLKDLKLAITSKQIIVNERLISLSDNEVYFLTEALEAVSELHNDIDDRQRKSQKMRKKSLKIQVYDNLFNASNSNILKNLKWNALGSSVSDPRLQTPNIIKAGIFYKMGQYEIENDYTFYGIESIKVCSNLLDISSTKAQRYLAEYNKFKRSLENKNNI